MASADATLVTSGTVAFEAMLVKCPLAVAYKVSALSAAIGRRLLKVDMFSLPNLLAGRRIVSEFIQEQCTPEALAEEMLRLLNSDNLLMKKEFMSLHQSIRVNSDELAARAVFKVIIDHKSGDEEIMEKVGRELTEPAQAVPGGTSTEETKPERPVLRVDPPLEEPEEEELAPPAVSEKPRV